MRRNSRWGTILTLLGVGLLVVANRGGSQPPAAVPEQGPPVRPLEPEGLRRRPPQAQRPPTIFEALMEVLDNTEEGQAIGQEQRDVLRKDLEQTNEVWLQLKADMKEGIRQANRKFVIDPSRHHPGVIPAPTK
jgi:hypothetical protein